MCRTLLHGASPSHVAVAIETNTGNSRLRLSFKGAKPISKTPSLEHFFDQIATNSPTDVSVVKLLPHSEPPDERLIAHLRAIIERKSHDELMDEIQTKNQELEQHRAHLEETVKERTVQLQEALETIQQQKERMEGELNIGREIQMSMIPLVSSLPDFDEISLAATLRPAREVGGDFYDFFLVGDDRFCFCIGDVSGKGVPAALFMAMTKTLIKSRAADDRSTASIMTHVNEELSRDNPSSMFVTVFAAILDMGTGELTYTNAGHNPPHLKRQRGSFESLAERHGPIIAAMPGMTYGEKTIRLQHGDILTLYTDGVTEAMDKDSNLFSDERLENLLDDGKLSNAEQTVEAILSSISGFAGDAEQSDDITILTLQYRGDGDAMPMHEMNVEIANEISEIPKVDEAFDQFAEKIALAPPVVQTFHLIFDELLNNIITYGYHDDERHIIEVRMERSGRRLSVTITDDGVPFNPLSQRAPDTSLSIEEREIGGLGIHLVKSMADECSYQRKIDKNVLSIMKWIENKGLEPSET
jgi:sigma-B regulation protein RsbU (phosphoserine phosphatase)